MHQCQRLITHQLSCQAMSDIHVHDLYFDLQPPGVWSVRYLPLKLLDPVPSDIEVARAQTPKNVSELASEIGLLPSEVDPQLSLSLSFVHVQYTV